MAGFILYRYFITFGQAFINQAFSLHLQLYKLKRQDQKS